MTEILSVAPWSPHGTWKKPMVNVCSVGDDRDRTLLPGSCIRALVITLITILITLAFVQSSFSQANLDVLTVDLLDRETYRISVPFGSRDGLEESTPFAMMDENGEVFGYILPHRISRERFWSGTLEEHIFGRVKTGTVVKETSLPLREIFRLRKAAEARGTLLKRAVEAGVRLNSLKELREKMAELDSKSRENLSMVESLWGVRKEQVLIWAKEKGMRDKITVNEAERVRFNAERRHLWTELNVPSVKIEQINVKIEGLNFSITRLRGVLQQLESERAILFDQSQSREEGFDENDLVRMSLKELERFENYYEVEEELVNREIDREILVMRKEELWDFINSSKSWDLALRREIEYLNGEIARRNRVILDLVYQISEKYSSTADDGRGKDVIVSSHWMEQMHDAQMANGWITEQMGMMEVECRRIQGELIMLNQEMVRLKAEIRDLEKNPHSKFQNPN